MDQNQKRPPLLALTGIRLFAILHLFMFHYYQGHLAQMLTSETFAAMPQFILTALGRGYLATGFFFILSGFLLTYGYLNKDGTAIKITAPLFFLTRFSKIIPLNILLMIILLPVMKFAKWDWSSWFVSTFMLQAWMPQAVLSWNVPAWAASALLCYYLLFPWLIRITPNWSKRQLLTGIGAAFATNLLLCTAYLVVNPDGLSAISAETNAVVLNYVKYHPIMWIAFFVSGIFAGRLFIMERPWLNAPSKWSWGDIGLAFYFVLLCIPPMPHYVYFRHGLLLPLQVAWIYTLATDRGLCARILNWPIFRILGDVSFSLYLLHIPFLFYFKGIFFAKATITHRAFGLSLLCAIGLAWGLDRIFVKPVSRKLVKKIGPMLVKKTPTIVPQQDVA